MPGRGETQRASRAFSISQTRFVRCRSPSRRVRLGRSVSLCGLCVREPEYGARSDPRSAAHSPEGKRALRRACGAAGRWARGFRDRARRRGTPAHRDTRWNLVCPRVESRLAHSSVACEPTSLRRRGSGADTRRRPHARRDHRRGREVLHPRFAPDRSVPRPSRSARLGARRGRDARVADRPRASDGHASIRSGAACSLSRRRKHLGRSRCHDRRGGGHGTGDRVHFGVVERSGPAPRAGSDGCDRPGSIHS